MCKEDTCLARLAHQAEKQQHNFLYFLNLVFTWHSTVVLRICLRQMMVLSFSRSLNILKKHLEPLPHLKEATQAQIFSWRVALYALSVRMQTWIYLSKCTGCFQGAYGRDVKRGCSIDRSEKRRLCQAAVLLKGLKCVLRCEKGQERKFKIN